MEVSSWTYNSSNIEEACRKQVLLVLMKKQLSEKCFVVGVKQP